MALGSTQPPVEMSTRNIPKGKGGRCVRLATSPPSRAECHEVWEPKPPGTLWYTSVLLRDSFTFYFIAKTGNVKWITIYSCLTHYVCFYSSPYQKVRLGTSVNIRLGGTCTRLLLVLWRLKLICIVFTNWLPAVQTEQCVSIVKNGRWMLCRNIIAVHCDNHT